MDGDDGVDGGGRSEACRSQWPPRTVIGPPSSDHSPRPSRKSEESQLFIKHRIHRLPPSLPQKFRFVVDLAKRYELHGQIFQQWRLFCTDSKFSVRTFGVFNHF
ncbi:hypothetical protein PS2_033899 [Malus domestica]